MNIDAGKYEEQPGEMEENPLENDFSSRKLLGLAIHTGHDDTDDAASKVGPVTGGSMFGAGANTVEDDGNGSTGEDEDGDSQADPDAAPLPNLKCVSSFQFIRMVPRWAAARAKAPPEAPWRLVSENMAWNRPPTNTP